MEILSKVHAKNLVEWAKDKENTVVLSADLTSSTEIEEFKNAYPDRFFSMGIAEQNMLSFAGGLAREGFIPLIHTFGVFIYRRAYDQIAMSVAYPNLPVRMFGFLPGVTTPGGATHQAIEDISVMRSLPNMTILECGDATDVESILKITEGIKGPVYIRMLRGELPRLFDKNKPTEFKKSRVISEGSDIVIASSGVCTEEAIRATSALKEKGLSIHHVHVTTLKPFEDEELLSAIEKSKYGVITMENHSVIGGLGSIIADAMAERGIGKRLYKIGIKDVFLHGASKAYLMKEYGLDAIALIEAVEKVVGKRFRIDEESLEKAFVAAVHSLAKPEAL
ncbi:transketolase family protein [Clostridium cylindrosporum]|uniref:Transketolase C-terminal section n=1 Tax=Clostridium cylindrosporum DSM 605 TaxID=1121307 RepID=A0A0J8G420_CLOCY|nr:transketolase C-terminal domain-containing protein [Clostridium cylindrosporum]KMT22446.1 transketolase C-terminal section [Clostridium cylindrosporum DSM 605]